VADRTRAAAMALRFLLAVAVTGAGLGLLAEFVPVPVGWTGWDPAARALRLIGVSALLAAPFAALGMLAFRERGRRLGWYATATLVVAAVGLLLAR